MRCKFRLVGIEYTEVTEKDGANWIRKPARSLHFKAVSGGDGEDCLFGHATPSGDLHMTVRNVGLVEKLELGKPYYLDFSPAPEE